MFDWNDEELSNIIWGETGESDDHIVPYPEATEDLHNKKEWHQEAAAIKLTEQKRPETRIDFHNTKLGSSSNLENNGLQSASGFGANSWPDLSLSSAATTEQGCTEVSKTLSKISKFSSSREETVELEKDAEIFRSAHEGNEQSDFVDYGWANIGSFDDLDRIFSNDDPIFGSANLDNGNELWPSIDETKNSAHISSDTCPSGALRNRSEPLEIKAEYTSCGDQSFALSYEKLGGSTSFPIQNEHAIPVDVGYAEARSKPTGMEQQDMAGRTTSVTTGLAAENGLTANEVTHKALRKKNLLKVRKKPQGKQERKVSQDFYGNWSPLTNPSRQFDNQLASSFGQSSPSSILAQQRQLQGAESLYLNIMNPYLAPPVYGNLTSTYPAMPMLSQVEPGVLRLQPLLSGYEVSPGLMNPVKKSVDSVKPLIMTPQEKIEKLRRRQQMQAMLAIQKQQKQLGHQVPCTNKSITQICPLEIQSHSFDGADPEIEDLSTLPSLDPPIEQDDSNTMSVAVDDYFGEDTILYRLHDIIAKLDIKIRLCIRDSLFRLAQSAMQRHYASDTSSTNKSSREDLEAIAREERNNQNRMPDAETETNPIDRTVAHLLFHRPLELTGNHYDKLDSSISAKIQRESKTASLVNLPMACMPEEGLKSNQQYSHQGFKNSCSSFEARPTDQFQNSPCIGTSENASNNGPADAGAQELEASQ